MRLAIIADIHGNLPALEAVIADMAARRVAAVVNLGDCVSGPLWPRETLDALLRSAWPTARGNHDRWVGAGVGLSAIDAYAAAAIDARGRAWLAGLPPRLHPVPQVLAVHARPEDDDAYLLEDIVEGRLVPALHETIASRLGSISERLVLTAHSHLPAILRLDGGPWIVNPGSVGCPAYDDPTPPTHVSETGSPAARYAVVEIGDAASPMGLAAEFISIPYDHAAAARRAAANDRPDWAHALGHGCMPLTAAA